MVYKVGSPRTESSGQVASCASYNSGRPRYVCYNSYPTSCCPVLSLHYDGASDDTSRGTGFRPAIVSEDPGPTSVHDIKEEASEPSKSRSGSIDSRLSVSASSSVSPTCGPIRTHFASSECINEELDSHLLHDRTRSASLPNLGPSKFNTVSPPDGHESDQDQVSDDSISSLSSYLRANAFPGHRDTLHRIKHTPNTARSSSGPLMLYPTSTISSIPSSLLTRHRDTFARINYRRRSALPVPVAVFKRMLRFLTFDEYKTLRLVCRMWLPSLPPPRLPASYRIPAEILQQVYTLVSPIDFDATRHTCKSWFLASLDRQLLATMSRRAGCYGSVQADLQAREEHLEARRRSMNGHLWADHEGRDIEDCHQPELEDLVSEEWVYSKRLAIESMLSPSWRGIYLKHSSTSLINAHARITGGGTVKFSLISKRQNRSTEASSVKVANSFTVSGCGKFALIIADRVVIVCQLLRRKPGIQPLTRIICPRKVLSVSMDTSSKRYMVAILLEGRVGMCCSLTHGFGDAFSMSATQGEPMQLGMFADIHRSNSASKSVRPTPSTLPLRRAEVTSSIPGGQFYVSRASEAFISPASNTLVGPTPNLSWFDDTFDRYSPDEDHSDLGEERVETTGIPIEDGPRTVYNNICSANDPPFSVAICPQRRCVAFGCRMGIELRWVDALTGSDLSRWFPLAAPSDFLYFLPTRRGDDSAKKLRLLSSAAGPYAQMHTTRPSMGSRLDWRTSPDGGQRQIVTRPVSSSVPLRTSATSNAIPAIGWQEPGTTSPEYADREHGVLRTVECDHYRAVPLSDGAHLLFTDPETGTLCLGSDAPLGGPTKLLRKVVCLPPDTESSEAEPQTQENSEDSSSGLWLVCYDTGKDLRWGVRIAAAYSDGRIMLYCVPSDVFDKMRNIRAGTDVWGEGAGVIAQSDVLMDQFMHGTVGTSHPNASTSSHAANEAGTPAEGPYSYTPSRSLLLRGIEIGRVAGEMVEALAVSGDFGGLRVWAFMQSGIVRMWSLFRKDGESEDNWVVGEDGVVRTEEKVDDCEGVSPGSTTVLPPRMRKGKEKSESVGGQEEDKQHIRFTGTGLDGAVDQGQEGGARQSGSLGAGPNGVVDEHTDHASDAGQDAPSNEPANEGRSQRTEKPPSLLPVLGFQVAWAAADWGCLSCDVEDVHDQLEITVLSDWRGMRLLDPYTVLLE